MLYKLYFITFLEYHNIVFEGVQSLGPKIETGVSSLSQGVIGINDSKDQSDQPVQSTLL